jgi:hypothetical protein
MVDGSNASTFPQYGLAQAGLYPDPSQWTNPYTSFNGPGQMPGWPTQYAGTPTNAATGQPIQPQPGMTAQPAVPSQPMGTTLNSTPPPVHGVAGLQPGQYDASNGLPAGNPMAFNLASDPSGMPNGMTSLGRGVTVGSGQPSMGMPQQQPQQAAQSGQPGGSYADALSLLANPGNPPTVGSPYTAQQATAGSGNQGILNSFIQNWQKGGIGQQAAPGIGGGSSGISFGANNPFFAALGGQR